MVVVIALFSVSHKPNSAVAFECGISGRIVVDDRVRIRPTVVRYTHVDGDQKRESAKLLGGVLDKVDETLLAHSTD